MKQSCCHGQICFLTSYFLSTLPRARRCCHLLNERSNAVCEDPHPMYPLISTLQLQDDEPSHVNLIAFLLPFEPSPHKRQSAICFGNLVWTILPQDWLDLPLLPKKLHESQRLRLVFLARCPQMPSRTLISFVLVQYIAKRQSVIFGFPLVHLCLEEAICSSYKV